MKLEIKTATIWALLIALFLLLLLPVLKPARKPAPPQPAQRPKHARPVMRSQEELDQEVYNAARKPIDEYYARHPEEKRRDEKEVTIHAREA